VSEAFGTAIDEPSSADIHFSVRPSRVLREGAKNGGLLVSRGGRARTSRGAPSRRLRESMAMMR
jgi:hypothetical protein